MTLLARGLVFCCVVFERTGSGGVLSIYKELVGLVAGVLKVPMAQRGQMCVCGF